MYVCICNAITDKQIRQAAAAGARTVQDLQAQLGIAARCGSCKEQAANILQESRARNNTCVPSVYQPTLA